MATTGPAVSAATSTTLYNVGGITLPRPFKVRRLGHFGVNVVDPEVARRFYERWLGLRISDQVCNRYRSSLQENQIRISAFPEQLAEAEVQRQFENSLRDRKRYWLSELVKFNVWPVLFICGADHSLPFLSLLKLNELEAVLVEQDWNA